MPPPTSSAVDGVDSPLAELTGAAHSVQGAPSRSSAAGSASGAPVMPSRGPRGTPSSEEEDTDTTSVLPVSRAAEAKLATWCSRIVPSSSGR